LDKPFAFHTYTHGGTNAKLEGWLTGAMPTSGLVPHKSPTEGGLQKPKKQQRRRNWLRESKGDSRDMDLEKDLKDRSFNHVKKMQSWLICCET